MKELFIRSACGTRFAKVEIIDFRTVDLENGLIDLSGQVVDDFAVGKGSLVSAEEYNDAIKQLRKQTRGRRRAG